jgi:hypothetical protein
MSRPIRMATNAQSSRCKMVGTALSIGLSAHSCGGNLEPRIDGGGGGGIAAWGHGGWDGGSETEIDARSEGGRGAASDGAVLRTADIFESQGFYAERSEAEQTWTGVLARRQAGSTPAGRDYEFWLQTTPIYSGTKGDAFMPCLNQPVEIRGKLVDVGYGPEIWPATIACDSVS